jgi:signal transduction histidine kinase
MSERQPIIELTQDEISRLTALSRVSQMLNESYDLSEVLNRVMDVVIDTLGAQRGLVMLDRGGEEPEVAAARGLDTETLQGDTFRYSRSLVQRVLETGEAVLSHDATEDARFAASRSLHIMGTRSIMCVPMRTRDSSLGLIYLDNQITSGLFTEGDLELLRVIADLAAAAIERANYFSHLVQNEKMAALGTLVAGIAHELNNPLTSVMGLAQLLRERLTGDGEGVEMASKIHKESLRCRDLVRELLTLSRREKAPRKPTALGTLVEGVSSLVAADYRAQHVNLKLDVPPDLPPVEINADQFTQVLLNLLTNARHALRGRDHSLVVVRAAALDGMLRLTVQDNGPGIPPQNMRQIFDPFFTTKPAGEGTGLGLSISHSIVAEHGGVLEVRNAAAGGAVFTIELPLQGNQSQPRG